MKHLIFTLTILTFSISIFGQNATYPTINKKTENDVYIKSVTTNEYYTQVNFIYKNSKSEGHYILLNPPGHNDAYYIKANGVIYRLLSTQNIGNVNGITAAYPDQPVEFSARFEKLPSYTVSFDLIEGATGTWDFYGIQLKSSSTTTESTKFRLDYNYIAIYDPQTETWGDWQAGDNTFVININEKGDIAHLKANGETVVYRKLSDVEEGTTSAGEHYQIIKALDEEGDVFRFQLFDNSKVGLKMMWGSFIVQFSNL